MQITILLVDDQRLFRETFSPLLNSDPRFLVIGETNCPETATGIALQQQPAIIFTEINMNPVDGFQLTRRLLKASPASKVIALSTHNFSAFVKRMYSCGGSGFMTKNSSIDDIRKCMLAVMAGEKFFYREGKEMLSSSEIETDHRRKGLDSLNTREFSIIQLINEGKTSQDIAALLGYSIRTIDAYRGSILKKLKLKNTAALVNFAHQYNLCV